MSAKRFLIALVAAIGLGLPAGIISLAQEEGGGEEGGGEEAPPAEGKEPGKEGKTPGKKQTGKKQAGKKEGGAAEGGAAETPAPEAKTLPAKKTVGKKGKNPAAEKVKKGLEAKNPTPLPGGAEPIGPAEGPPPSALPRGRPAEPLKEDWRPPASPAPTAKAGPLVPAPRDTGAEAGPPPRDPLQGLVETPVDWYWTIKGGLDAAAGLNRPLLVVVTGEKISGAEESLQLAALAAACPETVLAKVAAADLAPAEARKYGVTAAGAVLVLDREGSLKYQSAEPPPAADLGQAAQGARLPPAPPPPEEEEEPAAGEAK